MPPPAYSISFTRRTPSRSRLLTAAALLTGVLLAGCGGSSKSATGGGASAFVTREVASAVAFAGCIRSHGVPSFPDPKVGGQTVRMGTAATLHSPAFQSAVHACRRLLPKGAASAEPPSPQAQARMLDVSACMRKHGISAFPDPTSSPPANRGNSTFVGSGGYYLAIPSSIDAHSPAFEQAAAACRFR